MRVAIITESFLPQTNGVVNSVLRVLDHLADHGHDAVVLAPGDAGLPARVRGFAVHPLTAWPLPGYPQVRVAATPTPTLARLLADAAPDVVHLASPINVGLRGAVAARGLGLPTVAVYQTDVPGYARRYGVGGLQAWLEQRVRQTHQAATLTLAPSSASERQLAAAGVVDVRRWGRGVDADLFHPRRRSDALRAAWAPRGERVVGFVGRLAPEKQVADLRALAGLAEVALVVIGDGPERARLEAALPGAHFTGRLGGEELGAAMASLDVFVTPGESETFGQTIQEAMASGVPVVAPAAGGPLDLVDPSRTGWLYAPGDLAALRAHVADLVGDDAKRRAMGRTARAVTAPRSWEHVCAALLDHYRDAIVRNREHLRADRERDWSRRTGGLHLRV